MPEEEDCPTVAELLDSQGVSEGAAGLEAVSLGEADEAGLVGETEGVTSTEEDGTEIAGVLD